MTVAQVKRLLSDLHACLTAGIGMLDHKGIEIPASLLKAAQISDRLIHDDVWTGITIEKEEDT